LLPTIDTEALPLVRITYPALLTEADVDAYALKLRALFEEARIATVVDLRALAPNAAGAAGRQYLAAAIDVVTNAHPGRLVAEAIVMDSAIIRGLYTAYCWIRKDTSYPSRAFRDMQAAELWARAEFEKSRGASSTAV